MTKTRFEPTVDILAQFPGIATIEELDAETSVFAASPNFVRKNCGPIANRILDAVPDEYLERCHALAMLPNIDIRVHRLNVGESPAVPGWHCDGALRETYFSSPDIERIKVRDTVLATVSTDPSGVSNFDIVTEPFDMEVKGDKNDFGVWKQVHDYVEHQKVPYEKSQDGRLYQISVQTVHRCCPALVRGWRLFFRMSMWHNDYLGDQGKIARQQQVYIKSEFGW